MFFFWDFSPTHSPNPSLAPPGERGEPHLAASFKVGKLVIKGVLTSKRRHAMTRPIKLVEVA